VTGLAAYVEAMTAEAPLAKRPIRILGFDIHIEPNVVILAALVAWSLSQAEFAVAALTQTNVWLLLLLVVLGLGLSIVLHEMGHALVGRAFGMKVDGITLHVFGGIAHLRSGPKTALSELLMALAGPAVSVVLWIVFGLLEGGREFGTVPRALGYLSQMNLVLAIFNMLPAFPMDGGRVLRSLIWMVTKNPRLATSIAATIGVGFGGLLAVGGVVMAVTGYSLINGVWMVVMGLMIARIAKGSRPRRVQTAVPPSSD